MTSAVRKKYKDLMRSTDDMTRYFKEKAKPIVLPLQKTVQEALQNVPPPFSVKKEIKKEAKKEIAKEEEEEIDGENEDLNKTMDTSTQTDESIIPIVRAYLNKLSDPKERIQLDSTYGVRADGRGGTVIGNSKIAFEKFQVIVRNRKYKTTIGLLELLFKQKPNKDLLDVDDLNAYKEILMLTNAHRQMYSAEKPVNRNKGKKYLYVISVLFPTRQKTEEKVQEEEEGDNEAVAEGSLGKGMAQFNVNKLVNRLRLLIMSQKAGHTAHNEEIDHIVNSLRLNRIIE